MTHILLVEDNEMNRDMLSRRLLRKGFEVSLAVCGISGVEHAKKLSPDVVLMDVDLPGMDGLTATRTLRADGFTAPIIALTAHAMDEDRKLALQAGCTDFDTKPIDFKRLLATINKHAEKSSRQDKPT